MPDWFYRTAGQRCLFALPDRIGRALALGTIGGLGRSAIGRACIDFLGHMRPPKDLSIERAGIHFPARVGLGRRLDPTALALDGLARFGVGFLEVGPVALADAGRPGIRLHREPDETLREAAQTRMGGVSWWRSRLSRRRTRTAPLLVRLHATTVSDFRILTDALADNADVFVIESNHADMPPPTGDRPWLLAIDLAAGDVSTVLRAARAGGYAGVVLDAEVRLPDGSRRIGLSNDSAERAELTTRIEIARAIFGDAGIVLVTQAVSEPEDARRLLDAGADLLQADTGLLFTGPGLNKRCNEALETQVEPASRPCDRRETAAAAWFWGTVLGAAMSVGGFLALGVALTRVVLPYDEHYLGLTREMLRAINPRLLDFMTHDRVTLAGAMIGLGSLYLGLARMGVRRGAHWAQVTIAASAIIGFLSFFSFLGFGYFDPFHAFVSAALLPLSLLALALPRGGEGRETLAPEWRTDAAWLRAQWGQLLLVVHAIGLLGAGVTITTIGMTDVFVAEDLAYLCMTAESLAGINERVIPVVAHDRASLGGMLLANGVGLLLATLWGFRRGRAWLWKVFLWTALPAYVAAIGIHVHVGYLDWRHLLPAGLGAALFAGGLLLSRRYLTTPSRT